MPRAKLAALSLAVAGALFLLSACGRGSTPAPTLVPTPLGTNTSEALKPDPVITQLTASTVGVFNDYYAILTIGVRNNGAEGVIVVVGSISQGTETKKSELPVYLAQEASQTVKLVFRLQWNGGDWTPRAETKVP